MIKMKTVLRPSVLLIIALATLLVTFGAWSDTFYCEAYRPLLGYSEELLYGWEPIFTRVCPEGFVWQRDHCVVIMASS